MVKGLTQEAEILTFEISSEVSTLSRALRRQPMGRPDGLAAPAASATPTAQNSSINQSITHGLRKKNKKKCPRGNPLICDGPGAERCGGHSVKHRGDAVIPAEMQNSGDFLLI